MTGWFYGFSNLVGLYHAEVNLTSMVSNDIWYKNVTRNHFKRAISSYLVAISKCFKSQCKRLSNPFDTRLVFK